MRRATASKLKLMVIGLSITTVLLVSGCGKSTLYSWPYHHLTWHGEHYMVTTSYLQHRGKIVGYWTSYGTGETFALFSVSGVNTQRALSIETSGGYLLVIGIGKTNR